MLDTTNLQRESALKTLPRKISRNGQMQVLSRADYEARGLRKAHAAQRRAAQGIQSTDDDVAIAWSRELDRWIERERILLRIPLPREQAPRQAAAGPPIEAASTSQLTPPPAGPPADPPPA